MSDSGEGLAGTALPVYPCFLCDGNEGGPDKAGEVVFDVMSVNPLVVSQGKADAGINSGTFDLPVPIVIGVPVEW